MKEKVVCPHCGHEQELEPYNEWKMKGKDFSNPTKHNVVLIRLYECKDCNKKFRKGIPQK